MFVLNQVILNLDEPVSLREENGTISKVSCPDASIRNLSVKNDEVDGVIWSDTSDNFSDESVNEQLVSVPDVRRSERAPKPKQWPDFVTYSAKVGFSDDPQSVEDALCRPDAH